MIFLNSYWQKWKEILSTYNWPKMKNTDKTENRSYYHVNVTFLWDQSAEVCNPVPVIKKKIRRKRFLLAKGTYFFFNVKFIGAQFCNSDGKNIEYVIFSLIWTFKLHEVFKKDSWDPKCKLLP